jgi:hypothetical protein
LQGEWLLIALVEIRMINSYSGWWECFVSQKNLCHALVLEIQLAVVDEVHQRCSILQIQFLQDIIPVNFNCFYRDIQRISDLF